MENKKLIDILVKDMGELEELISDIKIKGGFDTHEIEFLHTRARGIQQLLHMVTGQQDKVQTGSVIVQKESADVVKESANVEKEGVNVQEKSMNMQEKGTNVQEKGANVVKESSNVEKESVNVQEKGTNVQEEGVNVVKESSNVEKESINVQEKSVNVVKESVNVHEESVIVREKTVERVESEHSFTVQEHETVRKNDVEMEEEEKQEANQRLGDSFLKGRSINDLLNPNDQNKLEYKLSNRPVNSIQSAIGINDRFQYIRELFEGSPEKFAKTVTSLDAMENIQDAVSFLQQNFKWKKNETSLKFVHLVKRRFSNE
jgi:chemotaxis protein histidine kinase CheA